MSPFPILPPPTETPHLTPPLPPTNKLPPTTPQAFGRRIATDKFIQLFFILNFGCLIGIIVWYALKKGKIKPPRINLPPLPNPFSAITGEADAPPPAAEPIVPTAVGGDGGDGGDAGDGSDGGAPVEETVQRYLRRALHGY
jgi:hypothetical protein